MNKQCSTCKHYSVRWEQCRKEPPHYIDSDGWGIFPMILPDAWCGEWHYKGDGKSKSTYPNFSGTRG